MVRAVTFVIVSCLVIGLIAAQDMDLSESEVVELLDAHNNWREKYGSPKVQWSPELEKGAHSWARELSGSDCEMRHSQGEWGENLYWSSARILLPSRNRIIEQVTATQVVDDWGSEVRWFEVETNQCSAPEGESCGHFTQLVWHDTKEIGCARSICESLDQIWVCRYFPAGNVLGQSPLESRR